MLPLFSIVPPSPSAESDALSSSPATNVPTTEVRFTEVPEVPSSNTNPVAPEVTPVINTPPFACEAISVGEGVPLKVSFVNGRISNRYSL